MKAKWITWLLMTGVVFAFCLSPQLSSALSDQGSHGRHGRMYDLQYQETNNISMPLTNFGQFGQNLAGNAGDNWPKGSGNTYIFGAGIWVGAILGNDTIVINGYNTVGGGQEFSPGPAEHNADHQADPSSHPEDHVYFSSNSDDIAAWPDLDSLGQPIVIGDEDTWAKCNAHNPVSQGAGEKPLPITVTTHTFAWNNALNGNMLFMFYTIKNDTTVTIDHVYVGMGSDLDIGNADNDLVGLDIGRSLGYTFTTEQEQGWEAPPPYYIAYRMLYAPKTSDTVYVGQNPANPDTIIYPGEHLVLTAFKKFTRNVDANNDIQRYLVMAGYDFNYVYGPFSDSIDNEPSDKRMAMSAGPFSLEPEEVETLLVAVMYSNGSTGGLKYLQSEGDAAGKLFDANWAQPRPPKPPTITTLVGGDKRVTLGWDNKPVSTPDDYFKVTQAAGDTMYKEYDFQGFRVWKSRTGIAGSYETVAEFDIADGIALLPDGSEDGADVGLKFMYVDTTVYNGFEYYYAITSYDYNTSGQPGDMTYFSQESGIAGLPVIPRSDLGDSMNPPTGTVRRLSSGAGTADAIAWESVADPAVKAGTYELRWSEIMENGGYPVFTYDIYDSVAGTSVLTGLEAFVGDSAATESTSFLHTTVDTIAEDSILTTTVDTAYIGLFQAGSFTSAPFNASVVNGYIAYQIGDSMHAATVATMKDDTGYVISSDTTIEASGSRMPSADSMVVTGNYSPYKDRVIVAGILPACEWAFHGGVMYEIRWKYLNDHSDTLTAEVWDVTNNAEVPFSAKWGDSWSFGPMSWGDAENVNCITAGNGPSRTLLYVCGVKYWLNSIAGQPYPLEWAGKPNDGDIWRAYNGGEIVPCRGNGFSMKMAPTGFAGTAVMDNIKVVPNPYIVRNDWELSPDYAKIQFTHLPHKCTIRIYTLAGDLIRTIDHDVGENDLSRGGTEEWDVLTKYDQKPASGVYIYHINSEWGTRTGKIAIIR
jgi:hypothetical protein